MTERPVLRLVEGGLDSDVEYRWFCGHCAATAPEGAPPPTARVCTHCGLGLLLETREDAVPGNEDAFLVVDSTLSVQAMSKRAETFLDMSEADAVDRPVAELLVPADAEAQGPTGFAAAVTQAAEGQDPDTTRSFVRPWNTFGVRMCARIATCGPPRAALIVLEDSAPRPRPRQLRAVESSPARRRIFGSR